MTKEQSQPNINDAITKRLDAVIRLLIEMNKPEEKQKFTEADAARLLKSVGLTPTEIAKVLGKSAATDVSQYLYPKKKPEKTSDNMTTLKNQEVVVVEDKK